MRTISEHACFGGTQGFYAADSRECRNCHAFESMNTESQKPRAKKAHELGQRDKQTCIDCHKGIAHKKPQGMTEADEG